MKTSNINLFLLPALIAGLGLIPAGRVTAQTFTNLHSFTGGSGGGFPTAGLILSGSTMYGTTSSGGSSGKGTVFKINTNGTGFTILHSFIVSDGVNPYADLILSGSTLYGTTFAGGNGTYPNGAGGNGTVFKVNTNGTGFTILHSFTASGSPDYTNSDGAGPRAGLVLSGNTLYGTANYAGSSAKGTVFAVNTDGTGFTALHSFTALISNTNSDGASPYGLILSGNTLYGTARDGGSSGRGTVFAVNTNGTGFTTLYSFTGDSDGSNPQAGLILSGNTLYGTAVQGGSSDSGTVFAVNTDGTSFTILYSFTATSGFPTDYINSDGAGPNAVLILSGNTLYGTAVQGGSAGQGTVFAVNTDGTGFANLHTFTARSGPFPSANSDGALPHASVVLSGTILYGTAGNGGSSGYGTVFSLSLPPPPPQLTISRSGANVILTWPTDAAGFTLQSTTDLVSPAVWGTVSPGPIVVNGQNAVTDPVSGTRKFYRLSQ